MTAANEILELVNTLEDILVKEFRSCQTLYNLTKDERVALSSNDVSSLLNVVEHKEALLDEMGQLDDARRMTTQEVKILLGLPTQSATLNEVISALDADSAGRLIHLRSGILTLMDKIRDLTHGNRALATSATERADAVQAFLLSLYQSPATYRPPGIPGPIGPAVAVEMDHIA